MCNKVLQIASDYPWAEFYQKLFNSLGKSKVCQDIYVFVNKSFKKDTLYPRNVTISKCFNKFDRYFFHLKHIKVLLDIKQKMDINDYYIIHAHSLFSNGYIAYKLKQEYDIPYIVAVRNTDVNVFFKRMIHLRTIGVNILKNAEKVVFISVPYKKYIIDKYIPEKYKEQIKDKSVVIPNGIDDYWLKNKNNNKVAPKSKRITLIYAGSINRNKNIDTTIKACERLIKQGYHVNYNIIGNIMDKKYMNRIKKYAFINYIPYCRKEDLINHYRNADIFIMPSKYETFGLVYAEAMSQGLPVIYTRGQGFDGHFDDGEVGYSVQFDSAEEIADRVKDILDRYETISRNCIEKVDRFDWDKIAKEYMMIYAKK